MIEQYVHWNEDIGEWQLKCVAYTGNNMRKQTPMPDKDKEKVHTQKKISCIVVFTPHVTVCFFWPSWHNFRDIELNFCILITLIPLIGH